MESSEFNKENSLYTLRLTPEFLQDAIDLAIKHDRCVSFRCRYPDKFNETSKLVDKKGCGFWAASKNDNLINIDPPSDMEKLERDGYTVIKQDDI